MSMDDVSVYMAKREKSTLTAPYPEGSPNLLNPPGSGSVGGGNGPISNLGVGVRPTSPAGSVPNTPQHYFQRATPQGSLSHLPSLSGGAAAMMTSTTAAGNGAAAMPPLGGSGNNAAAASTGVTNGSMAIPSSSSPSPLIGAGGASNAGGGGATNSIHNTPSHTKFRHISDVARIVVRNQHAAHADPTSVANTASMALDNQLTAAPKKGFSFETGDTGLINFLCSVPHLYMISNSDIRELSRNILRREFNLHDTILVNKQRVSHVYIVLKGRVEAYSVSQLQWDPRSQRAEDMVTHHERIGTIEVSNMFCIDSVVFSEPSEFLYCAGEEKTLLGLIPAHLFLSILNRNVAMRQSIGRKIADHMDIFICFKDFCRHIFSHETAKHEYLPLWQILHAYERLDNCIHTKRASLELDVDAWNYAIKRLPENLTTTFVFDLVRALPPFLTTRMKDLAKRPASAIGDVRYIVTKERRRCSWQLGMEGKTLVLLRDGFTDLLDFITCLCIHIIESNKLRGRLQGMVSPPAIDILDAKLSDVAKRQESLMMTTAASPTAQVSSATVNNTTFAGIAGAGGIEARDIREVLSKMPLSERERSGLHRNWGDSCLRNIYAVIMHREEYLLRVDVSTSRQFMTDPFHEWSLNLRKKLMFAMRLNPQGHLPEDLVIDIISSNTHSTKSLLSPFPRLHRDRILEHARDKKPDLFSLPWAVQEDLVYANCRNYTDFTGTGKEFNESLKKCGFEILEDTAMTGLQVDIVPVNQLDFGAIDPLLATRNCKAAGPRHFILNMDFAFGAQADGITATLVDTFGKHIRSFNVMGKAGGIASTMRRGDIQLASHVLLSKSSLTTEDYLDELRSCGNMDLTTDFVQGLCGNQSKIQVFNGPVLTIPGTMLQNDKLLLYYRHIWHCVGVEMEGSYFARQLKENIKAKLLDDQIMTRFAYYTSDMPLHSLQGDASLSTPMKPNEGTPPLYAVARALLIRILNGSDQPMRKELSEVCGPSESLRVQLLASGLSGGLGLGGVGIDGAAGTSALGDHGDIVVDHNGGITYAPSVGGGSDGGAGANPLVGAGTPPLMRDMSMRLDHHQNHFNSTTSFNPSKVFTSFPSSTSNPATNVKGSNGNSYSTIPPNPRDITRANSLAVHPAVIGAAATAAGTAGTNPASYTTEGAAASAAAALAAVTPTGSTAGPRFAQLGPNAATAAVPITIPHSESTADFHRNNSQLNDQLSPTTRANTEQGHISSSSKCAPSPAVEDIDVSAAPSPNARSHENTARFQFDGNDADETHSEGVDDDEDSVSAAGLAASGNRKRRPSTGAYGSGTAPPSVSPMTPGVMSSTTEGADINASVSSVGSAKKGSKKKSGSVDPQQRGATPKRK